MDANGTVLVVSLKSDAEQLAEVVDVLRQLEIPADVVDEEVGPRARVALRIPADRVVAAVVALEQHGFARVRAYARGLPE